MMHQMDCSHLSSMTLQRHESPALEGMKQMLESITMKCKVSLVINGRAGRRWSRNKILIFSAVAPEALQSMTELPLKAVECRRKNIFQVAYHMQMTAL